MYPSYFHLAAYSASLAFGSTLTPVAALTDQVLTRTTANNYILPEPGRLLGWYAAGVSISDAQLNTPSLRYVGLPFCALLNNSLTIPSPPAITWWGTAGPPLPKVDEIQILHSLGGAANEQEFSLLWFQFRAIQPAAGIIYRVKFTATIATVANTWTSGSISPFATLPQGVYQVVGGDCIGANLVAWRLIFPGSFYRPGALGRNAVGNVPYYPFLAGGLGVWGQFASVNLPLLECLATGANTAQTLYLDVIRIGDYQGPTPALSLAA